MILIIVRMAYGLPYGMASQNIALCVFIAAFLHVSLGKTWIYRFQEGKYLREVDPLKNKKKKKESVGRYTEEEKQKLRVFNPHGENHRIPPFSLPPIAATVSCPLLLRRLSLLQFG